MGAPSRTVTSPVEKSVWWHVATRSSCVFETVKPVSFMPRASKMRSRMKSDSGMPDARAMRTPRISASSILTNSTSGRASFTSSAQNRASRFRA